MNSNFRPLASRLMRHWIFSTSLMVLSVLGFRSAIADWNDVPTGSMKPTILIGDRIYVNKLAYDLKVPFLGHRLVTWGDPARGDVVICWSPADGARLVKRVVGVPGDVIEMKSGRLVINGEALDYRRADGADFDRALGSEADQYLFYTEDLAGHSHIVAAMPGQRAARNFGPVAIGPDQYFMMGDNRDNSADSRYFGFVPRSDVVGRVEGIAFSLDYEDHYKPRWWRFFTQLI
ncbi:MAG: signal peptidase I [Candidatus Krumholzibacteriota bacterium]